VFYLFFENFPALVVLLTMGCLLKFYDSICMLTT